MISPLNHGSSAIAAWGLVIVASLIAAVIDARTRRIPNRLTIPLLATGLAFNGAMHGAAGLIEALAATLVVALPFVLLFVLAKGGAGDAKLMGAIGACLGLAHGAIALACVAAAGVLVALAASLCRHNLGLVLINACRIAGDVAFTVLTRGNPRQLIENAASTSRSKTIPYGVAIFVGVAAAALGVVSWA